MDFLYCDHQSIGLIDSPAISLAPLFLTSILILGLNPRIRALVLFELKTFFLLYIMHIYCVFFSAIYDKPKKRGGLQSKIMGPSVSKYSGEPNIGVSQI